MENNNRANSNSQEFSTAVRFLINIEDKTRAMVQHLDTQTNILIGFSSALFLFSAGMIVGNKPVATFYALAFFSAMAVIVGLFAIHPPRFMRKRGQNESIMYNKKIAGFSSCDEYKNELTNIIGNHEAVVEQYAREIYNLAAFYYRPKRKLFKTTRSILLAGVIISALLFFITTLFF
ncbi:MAG: hypothetical protein CO002_02805 [Candidatus Portnoybacteria bacterium CG_4_8_14_3_um_filter_44_10]|uniref:Pycsar effector protein domain-containing protein n=2 Tax=Candidatus Portnoyibacteriota TaxID=1817913 RepID=A0A2M7IFL0_9BACT|nr:MAG: hypothetical protein CO002_02805 [Candidatus Portnoybacteria bacterium CG_4_8_14_3_um_filter_44_10]